MKELEKLSISPRIKELILKSKDAIKKPSRELINKSRSALGMKTPEASRQGKAIKEMSGAIKGFGKSVKESPRAKEALIGAGVGGGIGALSTVNDIKSDKKTRLRRILMGAGLGAGASMGIRKLREIKPRAGIRTAKKSIKDMSKSVKRSGKEGARDIRDASEARSRYIRSGSDGKAMGAELAAAKSQKSSEQLKRTARRAYETKGDDITDAMDKIRKLKEKPWGGV